VGELRLSPHDCGVIGMAKAPTVKQPPPPADDNKSSFLDTSPVRPRTGSVRKKEGGNLFDDDEPTPAVPVPQTKKMVTSLFDNTDDLFSEL
jgi:hypothetical protein